MNTRKNIKTYEEYSNKPDDSRPALLDTPDAATSHAEGLLEMANLPPKRTGLPFVVWVYPNQNVGHDARVKLSHSPKALAEEMTSIALRPEIRVIAGTPITEKDFKLIKRWIELNYDTILAYWNHEIEYTEDLLSALRPLRS